MQNSVPKNPYVFRIVLFSFLNGHNKLSQRGHTALMFRCSCKKKCQCYMTEYSAEDIQRKNMSLLHSEDSLHMTVKYSLFISESVKRSVRVTATGTAAGDGLLS